MANIANRSPWEVKVPKTPTQTFRLKSQAVAHLAGLGLDPTKLPPKVMKQLETAFEAQITRKDDKGVKIMRSGTFDTEEEARKWAKAEEAALQETLDAQGGFNAGFETITVKAVLETFYHEHYREKRSYIEIGYRIPRLIEWLGPNMLFRLLKRSDMLALKRKLNNEYSESSVRNFFTVLTTLYDFVAQEWQYPVTNIARGINLRKPKNAIQRDWVGDEEDRLMKSPVKRSPWLVPIVELALEMAFRRGELVQAPVRISKVTDHDRQTAENQICRGLGRREKTQQQDQSGEGGLKWEDINWLSQELRLPEEKNDHTKPSTEFLGRELPITPRMHDILMPLYEASPTKKGLVFSSTINSVSDSFRIACQKAEPPIENLTFHSLRKIATKSLSRRVTNPHPRRPAELAQNLRLRRSVRTRGRARAARASLKAGTTDGLPCRDNQLAANGSGTRIRLHYRTSSQLEPPSPAHHRTKRTAPYTNSVQPPTPSIPAVDDAYRRRSPLRHSGISIA